MKTEFEFKKIGGSTAIFIPKTYVEHLKVKEGDKGIMQDDEGKHGEFVSIWKKQK